MSKKNEVSITTDTSNNTDWYWIINRFSDNFARYYSTKEVVTLRPDRIIYNPPATIVYWNDGTKTVVKTHNEEFSKDHGLAMAFVKRIYGSRSEFLRDVESGYEPVSIKEE